MNLAARQHIDEKVLHHEEAIKGNGKPGLFQIRDKVMSWEMKINALILAVAGDVIFRIITLALNQ
jgi:hypothetical protein